MKLIVRILKIVVIFIPMLIASTPTMGQDKQQNAGDRILGKWITEQKDLIVEIYNAGQEYKARVVWFSDKDDLSRPACTRTDIENPDPTLRKRKIIGMDVLKMLTYKQKSDTWEEGMIYDAVSGREWSSCAYISKAGILRVKGYWRFKFISKGINFYPLNSLSKTARL